MMQSDLDAEVKEMQGRYAKRVNEDVYNIFRPEVLYGVQEKERVLVTLLKSIKIPAKDIRLLEVGCGNGANLLQLLRLGFDGKNLIGNELLEERISAARRLLPESVSLVAGDALKMEVEDSSFDIVFQSTVFTSILSDEFQGKLAKKMWAWVKPGGAVLWYDFVYNNPRNPDVRGVPVKRIKELFPDGVMTTKRLTLAPPISRKVTRLHPSMYTIFNLLPLLRTHVLCLIKKPKGV